MHKICVWWIELLKIYEAKCKQCTLVSKMDKLCIAINNERNIFYIN